MGYFAALLLIATSVASAADVRLSNRFLDVTAEPVTGALHVSGKRSGAKWDQKSPRPGIVWRSISIADGKLLFVSDAYRAELKLDASRPEFEVTIGGEGPMKDLVSFPLPFVTAAGSSLVVPMNEGILYPAEDDTIGPMQLVAYGGHGISMPWFGVFRREGGAGVMAIIETPDDASIDINRVKGDTSSF